MNAWPVFPELRLVGTADCDFSSWVEGVLKTFITALDRGITPVIIPRAKGLWKMCALGAFHLHPEYFLQLSGGCRFEFPYQTVELLPGQILQVPVGMPHRETPYRHRGGEFANLVFMPGDERPHLHLARTSEDRRQIVSGPGREFATPSPFARLVECLNHPGDQRQADRRAALRHLTAALLHLILAELQLPPPIRDHGREYPPKVAQAMQFIHAAFPSTVPNVREIAAGIGCSPNYLSGLFTAATGMRLGEYINAIRLDYARRLLRSSKRSVGEIAWSCGFQDAGYFAELYSKRFGLQPSQDRRNSLAR